MNEPNESKRYLVVLNDEEQYSVWPAGQPVPAGWVGDGFEGSRGDCLDHIGQVWTDLRPRSVRRHAQGAR
ncbi:MbtH family protein [Catellatospora tritici]|uniref:MbtH family protein n=1 Tax=Catellatospora tritici TaxID=2851566 RepID=UPI001C2D53E8|nr:MbtH family NRPS accessory protein [Catellatospora tritici]MBV1850528.1 MbtH family NRPS accessory protein [Catellatospora tritici]